MNIYDVPELQKYLNPRGINPMNFQGAFRTNVPFNPMYFQGAYPTTIQRGITASSAAIPFGSPVDIAQGFTRNTPSDQGTNFQFLESANENEIDEVMDTRSGIAKLFEFLQRFSPVANIARGIESIRNRFDTRKAIQRDIQRDTQGTINNIVSPRIMNMQPTAQDRGRGSIPSRSSPTTSKRDTSPSSSYSQASYARRR